MLSWVGCGHQEGVAARRAWPPGRRGRQEGVAARRAWQPGGRCRQEGSAQWVCPLFRCNVESLQNITSRTQLISEILSDFNFASFFLKIKPVNGGRKRKELCEQLTLESVDINHKFTQPCISSLKVPHGINSIAE